MPCMNLFGRLNLFSSSSPNRVEVIFCPSLYWALQCRCPVLWVLASLPCLASTLAWLSHLAYEQMMFQLKASHQICNFHYKSLKAMSLTLSVFSWWIVAASASSIHSMLLHIGDCWWFTGCQSTIHRKLLGSHGKIVHLTELPFIACLIILGLH